MAGIGVRSGEHLGVLHSATTDGNEDNYTYTAAGVPTQKTFSGMVGQISLGATVGTCTLGESNEPGGGLSRYTGVAMGSGLGGKLEGEALSQGVHHQAPNSATLQKFGRKDKRALNNQTQLAPSAGQPRKQQSSSSRVMAIQRKRQTHSQLSNHQPTELNSNFTQVSSNTKPRVTQSSSSPPHYAHGLAVNSTGQSAAGIAAGGPPDGQ